MAHLGGARAHRALKVAVTAIRRRGARQKRRHTGLAGTGLAAGTVAAELALRGSASALQVGLRRERGAGAALTAALAVGGSAVVDALSSAAARVGTTADASLSAAAAEGGVELRLRDAEVFVAAPVAVVRAALGAAASGLRDTGLVLLQAVRAQHAAEPALRVTLTDPTFALGVTTAVCARVGITGAGTGREEEEGVHEPEREDGASEEHGTDGARRGGQTHLGE